MPYLTTEQLRERLTSDSSFTQPATTAYTTLLTTAIANAEDIVNAYIGDGRPFAFDTVGSGGSPVTRTYTGDGEDSLLLDKPLQTFTSATNDGTAITSADVWLEPANETVKTLIILKESCWSETRQAITITGVWGWGNPPAAVVEATAEIAVRIVKGRAAGYSDTVGVNPDGSQQYIKALPPLVKLALDLAVKRYRRQLAGSSGMAGA